ncbi:MAG: citrate synthase [Halobacteriaceae archaeon]
MSEEIHKGLEGITVAETSLSYIDGDEGRLIYRGYPIQELAKEATYEEVLYLLWEGDLPTKNEFDTFTDTMANEREIDEEVLDTIRELARTDEEPMAALRTATSQLSAYDPAADADPTDLESTLARGRRITAKIPTIIAAFTRLRDGKDPISPNPQMDHASNFLYMLNGEEPDDILADVFDQALVLHADHGLNASTFAAMVTASTLSDINSAITSAIGTLHGPLHGGANANVMRMLKDIDDSDKDSVKWVKDALDRGERIAGFGHRVYNVKDPRAKILGQRSEELGESAGNTKWYEYSNAIEEYMMDEKGLAPNVDFYSASTYYQMNIPIDIFTPIFAMSRVGGWVAHVLEQYQDNRLIRPRGEYVGPENQTFVPMEDRS